MPNLTFETTNIENITSIATETPNPCTLDNQVVVEWLVTTGTLEATGDPMAWFKDLDKFDQLLFKVAYLKAQAFTNWKSGAQ